MVRLRVSTKELVPLLLAVLVLYWRPAFGQGVFFQRDIFLYWIPQIEWAVRSLAQGRLPQWDASIGFGLPFLSDPSFQSFYPATWLNLFLQPPTVFSVMVVGHTLLGAVGAFHLLRRRLRSREAAWVGAIAFVAAGALVSSANLWHHYSSAMYMPWVADAFLRMRRGPSGWVRLGVVAALQALAGSADVILMTAFGLLFLLPSGKRLVKLAPRLIAAAFLCVTLAAVQWLPAIRGVAGTERTALPAYDRLYWSVPPIALMDFVAPLTGVAHAQDDPSNPLEHRFRLITSMYLGASTLPLLLVGACRWPRGLALLLVSLALALGRHGPLAFVSEWPVVSMVRFPSKMLWLFSLCSAVLAAVGAAALARRPARFAPAPFALGAILLGLAAAFAYGDVSARSGAAEWEAIWKAALWAPAALGLGLIALSLGRRSPLAIALVVTVDLVAAGQGVNAYSDGEMMRMRPAVVDTLHALDAYRVFVLPGSRREGRSWKGPAHWSDEEAYVFGQGQLLTPPQGTRFGLRGSFDGDSTGLASRYYALFSKAVTESKTVALRWLQLGGVTHVLRFEGKDEYGMEVVGRVRTFHEGTLLVLRVPEPRPPAYLVSRVRQAGSPEDALRTFVASDFDPAEEIVRLDGQGPVVWPAAPFGGGSAVHIEEMRDGKTTIRVRLDAPRTLVVLDSVSEGWSACVDGEKADIHPANLLFQSMDLEPGEHLVELRYQTPGLALGFAISVLAWIWLLLRAGVRNKRRNREADLAPAAASAEGV